MVRLSALGDLHSAYRFALLEKTRPYLTVPAQTEPLVKGILHSSTPVVNSEGIQAISQGYGLSFAGLVEYAKLKRISYCLDLCTPRFQDFRHPRTTLAVGQGRPDGGAEGRE